GSEVASRLYSLTDPGGRRLSLRPEFTASVIRAYIEERQDSLLPLRWQYAGPVFRYDDPAIEGYRQFTQVGGELMGSSSPRADAEIISIACSALGAVKLRDYRMVIGHAGLLPALLDGLGLSERAKMVILGGVNLLKQGDAGVSQVRERLEGVRSVATLRDESRLETPITSVDEEAVFNLVQRVISQGNTLAAGGRTIEEIVSRLQSKMDSQDTDERLERGVSLAAQIVQVKDTPARALSEGRRLVESFGLPTRVINEIEHVVRLAEAGKLSCQDLQVDLGLLRGLAYYTGVIFEGYVSAKDGDKILCGGGRYDGLVRALGGSRDVPALGFACIVEHIKEALDDTTYHEARGARARTLVVPADGVAFGSALILAEALRAQGKEVEMEAMERPLEESLIYASRRGAQEVVVVAGESGESDHYVYRNGGWARVAVSATQ
ncbi:MAG: histidyl-tRNA synthetase 2, partial [Dehalococcoidia bacterium]|nr:histidyl-tRNA synthetase 2 [Dehalococcoidia bacterium]